MQGIPSLTKTSVQRRDHFLSPAEHRFFLVLRRAVAAWAEVYPKVSLGSLFHARVGRDLHSVLDTRLLNLTHVDYLLCRPETLHPRLGVMLDVSPAHNRLRRRNLFVDQVFAAARVPLVHVKMRRSFDVNELGELLADEAGLLEIERASLAAQHPRSCPRCGRAMVRGVDATGALVWTCINFPCCRTVQADEPAADKTHA